MKKKNLIDFHFVLFVFNERYQRIRKRDFMYLYQKKKKKVKMLNTLIGKLPLRDAEKIGP